MRLIYSLLILFSLSSPVISKTEEAELVPKGAWVRATVANQPLSSMYLSLRNTTDKTIEVIAVETDAAQQGLIHKTIDEDGVAKMRHQKSVVIEPGKKVIFKEGGLHVMLVGLHKPIAAGDKVTVNFKTKQGKSFSVEAMARTAPCPYGCCDP